MSYCCAPIYATRTLRGLVHSAAIFSAATLLLVAPLSAANIPTLFNTGLSDLGVPLVDEDLEIHYELILIDVPDPDPDPMPPDDPFVQDGSGGFPIGPWLADSADFDGDVPSDSRWITPSPDTNGPPADYHYEIVFDLGGFDETTAVINGGWSSDNPGIDIIVNGTSTFQTHSGNFGGWEAFDIPTDMLVPGFNSIIFVSQNAPPGDNPAGLRVDFASRDADPLFLLGDFNTDTMINMDDFQIMLNNFLTGTTHAQGDMELDNDVDLDDFNLFVAAFNQFNGGGAPNNIPEPGACALLGLGMVLMTLVRRRRRQC